MSAVVLRTSSQSGTLGFESLQHAYSMHLKRTLEVLGEASLPSRQALGFSKVGNNVEAS